MLYWYANFQIPMSGTQSAEVFAIVKEDMSGVRFYSDKELDNLIFEKDFSIPTSLDPEDYLLTLEYFQNYKKV